MAHLLRKSQSGLPDLSASILPSHLLLSNPQRLGISSRITQLAYDPIQSLLAVGTASSRYGAGQIYVFGGGRVQATFPLARKGAGVKWLGFCADRVVCLDDRGDLMVVNLGDRRVASWSPPGGVGAVASDAALDYVILGMLNGEILAYDMDRETLAPLKLPNYWQEKDPRSRHMAIVSLAFHPRDIGTLLIGYTEGAAVFSFKQNKALKFFHYHLPKGAPGGDSTPSSTSTERNPKLQHAIWHPTGIFVLAGYEDSSLVVWDPRDGRLIMARTLTDTNVDRPGGGATTFSSASAPDTKSPLMKIAWCANQDPDDTAILIAGGASTLMPTSSLTVMELGRTPNYATSTWQLLSGHFEAPKRVRSLPTPPNVEVVSFCLIPRKSPWYAGSYDPIAILALLSSGEVTTLSFPSGYPISPTNQLHISMAFVHPFSTSLAHSPVERSRWLGMVETRSSGPKILRGGIEATAALKRFESRNVVITGHADGTVRMWDAGNADEIENESVLQADVTRAVGRLEGVTISHMSFSAASGELAVGLKSGEVVVFRWNRNKNPGRDVPPSGPNKPGVLTNIVDRKDPSLVEGLHPFTLLNQQDGPCTAIKVSDIGFIAAGFEGGSIVVIDLRGPAVILNTNINGLTSKDKPTTFRKTRTSAPSTFAYVVSLEFSVMTLDTDDYSSILLHAGTNHGHISTFKILPSQNGQYTVTPVGTTTLDDKLILLHPINVATGKPAYASPTAVASLREGARVEGVLLAVTKSEARIFRPSSGKGAHKAWEGMICHAAAMTRCQDIGWALVGVFGDGNVRAFSIPGLREIASLRVNDLLDVSRLSEAVVTVSGDVIAWSGPAEMVLLNIWGAGEHSTLVQPKLVNPSLLIPPRPTISNFEWVSGTQYMTPSDLDLLIGGPSRPPSKRLQAQTRLDAASSSSLKPTSTSNANLTTTSQDNQAETWGNYLTRQLAERTENLNLVGENVERLEENSSSWAEEAGKFVGRQKKALVMGAVRKGFGL